MSNNCAGSREFILFEEDLIIEIPQTESVASEIHLLRNLVIESEKETLVIEFPAHVIINESSGGSPSGSIDAVIITVEAGDQINVNRVVSLGSDGRIVHADKDDDDLALDVLGISRQSGATGQFVEVVKFGKLTGAMFGAIAENFFLGNDGMLTDTPPLSGTWLAIGMQLSSSEFFVNIGEPIRRN